MPKRKEAGGRAGRATGGRGDRAEMKLVVPVDLGFRLTTLAALRRVDRSTFAAELIDAGLRRYAADAPLRELATGGGAGGEPGADLGGGT